MPVRYEIEPPIASLLMEGDVGPGDVVECLSALAADPAHRPGMPQLVDMRAVTRVAQVADHERVAYAFERMREHFAGARCAVVVATPVMFGAVRQFGTLAERAGLDVAPFMEMDEAREWLGVGEAAHGSMSDDD